MVKKSIVAIVISVLVLCGVGVLFYEYNSLDNRLWRRLVEDRPEISKCTDEYEKLDIIRDWAYENVLFAGHKETYSSEPADIYIQKMLDEEQISYGYYCGGVASVLSHVYTYLGYPACCLDMAVCEDGQTLFSHVVTLVHINEEWIVQDPTFNLTYIDEKGNHISVDNVRERLKEEQQIIVRHGATKYANCIMAISDYTGIYEVDGAGIKSGDYYLYKQETDFDIWERKVTKEYEILFKNEGWEENAMILYMHPWGLYFPNEYGKYVKDADSKYEQVKKALGILN